MSGAEEVVAALRELFADPVRGADPIVEAAERKLAAARLDDDTLLAGMRAKLGIGDPDAG